MPPPARAFFVLPGGIFSLFRESAASVAGHLLEGSLALHLTENFRHQHDRSPAQAEIRSLERSLPALDNALIEAGLDDVEVIVEYSLPLTSKRADALRSGAHPTTNQPSYVVVELKQWSPAYPSEDGPLLCRIDAYARDVHSVSDSRVRSAVATGPVSPLSGDWDPAPHILPVVPKTDAEDRPPVRLCGRSRCTNIDDLPKGGITP
ncbi:hypothetical protein AB0N07_47535 [Streptomyces sp. NPDC051172]|uniref:hypothetical protein n=1 Tax=Streptomyces sp. NPDC051172 TaxID=3155796 RepID=UPI00341C876A